MSEPVSPERWQQIEALYHAALERPPAKRAAWLAAHCAADPELRREVETLLAYDEQAADFIEAPALELAAREVAEEQRRRAPGQQVGAYRILSQLGVGGMGEVYLAEDTRLGRRVAIKFLPEVIGDDPQARRRFLREARAAAALDHPNICAIHEVNEEAGQPFIVMQYVGGETLAECLRRQPLGFGEALDFAIQIVDALAEAHAHHIIHRDIKPENIIINSRRQVKVLDFGLAKIVQSDDPNASVVDTQSLISAPGAVLGTVPYMSPEQARGEPLDERTDIFSLGAVLYEMITGRSPFAAPSHVDTLMAIVNDNPPPLARFADGVPDELQRIIGKALRKDKDERYQTMRDLLIDLKSLRDERTRGAAPGTQAQSDSVINPTQLLTAVATAEPAHAATKQGAAPQRARRWRWPVALFIAAVAAALAADFFLGHRQPALTERDTVLLADFVNKTGEEVFDGTLKQGLAVQLQQSPFLNLLPETRVVEALKLMNRVPGEPVTRQVGREICQRQGIKALITGNIVKFERTYSLTLEAVNSQTDETLALAQRQAEGKDQVLKALSDAATELRAKLGESLASIQRFDKPLEQATTSSLDALRFFSLGQEAARGGDEKKAIGFYGGAIERDPDFALAYAWTAVMYDNTDQPEQAARYAAEAFKRRERVSEYERLVIEDFYYGISNGELNKSTEVLEQMKRLYPRNPRGPEGLANCYFRVGQPERALAEAREALRLDAASASAQIMMGIALLSLDRMDEARQVLEQALRQNPDHPFVHYALYLIAFAKGDAATMAQQHEWMRGKPDEPFLLELEADIAAFDGKWRESEAKTQRALAVAAQGDAKEVKARLAATAAWRGALCGQCAQAHAFVTQALATERNHLTLARAALALGLCGDVQEAQPLVNDMISKYPADTIINHLSLPAARAAIDLQRGNAEPALEDLRPALDYEAAGEFAPQYLRGLAYLKLKRGAEAAAEFQKIIDHRGQYAASPLYPLAHLGAARAAVLSGDTDTARRRYEDFLKMWKDADAGLPALQEARKEYASLK